MQSNTRRQNSASAPVQFRLHCAPGMLTQLGIAFRAWTRRSQVCSAAITLLVVLACTQSLMAQSGRRDQRRQFVEGLLRTLIESQVDRKPRESDRRGQPTVAPDLVRARQHFGELSTHSTQLVHHLNTHAARSPAAKQFLGDALKLKASMSHIKLRSGTARRLEDLQPDFRSWDRDWRLLSYRLRQAEGLDDECLQCVVRLNELETTLCGLLGVTPQVDYRELLSVNIALSTSLAHLIEDIEIELSSTNAGLGLAAEAGRVHQRSLWFGRAVHDRRGHEELVERFGTFYGSWRALAVNIRGVRHRHLDRNVRRIDESTLLLHELLWLPQPIEYVQLTHLTTRLSADVNRLFDAVSLNVLLELPGAERVLPSASEFFGLCENFADSVATQAPLAQLRIDYRYLVDAWPELAGCFSAARRPEVVRSLRTIEESFVALRDTIGLSPQVDWRRSAELAASLSALSDRLFVDVQRFIFTSANYGRQFRGTSAQQAANFRNAAHRLHQSLVQRDETAIQDRCEKLATAWGTMTDQCYRKMSAADQGRFGDAPVQIAQQLVQLQAMLQL